MKETLYSVTGMDAQVSYVFHSERKLHPEKFKNQLSNQVKLLCFLNFRSAGCSLWFIVIYDLRICLAIQKPISLLFCTAETIFKARMHARMVLCLSVSSNVSVISLVALWLWNCLVLWKGILVTSRSSEIWCLFYSLKNMAC